MAGSVRISEAASLGLHAMAYIASMPAAEPVRVNEMARVLGVSEAHLGKVLQGLARRGFVSGRRGPKGGYVLGRPADAITLLEIYEAVEGPFEAMTCLLDRPVCGGGARCVMGSVIRDINRQLEEHLRRTRLSDLPFEPIEAMKALAAGATT